MYIYCANITILITFITGILRVTIERLDSLNIVIGKHEMAFASVGIDGKH